MFWKAITAIVMLFLWGCTIMKPDLTRLYSSQQNHIGHPPVILVHGAFGGRLCDNKGEERWPGNLFRLLFHDYQDLSLQQDKPTLSHCGITDKVAGEDYYHQIEQTLQQAGGYQLAEPGQPITDLTQRHYYIFDYDWRQDLQQTAQKLDELVNQIRTDHQLPELKVDIVAHSMGGLITRYWLRYGGEDVLNDNTFPINNIGHNKARKTILVGTPNFGSVSALQQILQGADFGVNLIAPEILWTFPSAFQLLPHPLRGVVLNQQGKPLERDLFDVDIWQALEWGPFAPSYVAKQASKTSYIENWQRTLYKHLERARRFVWSLSIENPAHTESLIVFGGDCHPTPARILIEDVGDESLIRLHPSDIKNAQNNLNYEVMMIEPGDGSVTKQSLLANVELDPLAPRHPYSYFPLDYAVMICEEHSKLPGNLTFQDNLLHALLDNSIHRQAKSSTP